MRRPQHIVTIDAERLYMGCSGAKARAALQRALVVMRAHGCTGVVWYLHDDVDEQYAFVSGRPVTDAPEVLQ